MRLASILALLTLLLATACGGGGGGPRLTKQEWASKADAICGKYNQQVKALDNPSNLQELASVAERTIPILGNAIDDIRKLRPPESEQDTVDQWLDEVEKLQDDLEEIRDKAKDDDMAGVQAVVPQAQQHNTRSNELATELGMTVCNKD
jgi:Rad3-related DNA helicase